jgi:GNAT superfamily N-acetyltransferase
MRVERLGAEQNIGSFHSGVKALDDWLRLHALENQRRNLSRTFLLIGDGGDVAAYYALTMGGVAKSRLPASYGRGLPNVELGMVLLARLAVAAEQQGRGLGRDLLVDAIFQAALAGEHAAARFIAVDPIDDSARRFYSHFGFRDVPGDGDGRMYLRIDEALASFAEINEQR